MTRDIGTDDPRVRVRPGRASRPRTKIRPDYSDRPLAQVITVDRGRFRLIMEENGIEVNAVKARELGRRALVVGDRVRVTGDISGAKDTLARVVVVEKRTSELRRSTEEGDGRDRVVVANADQLAVVAALADPGPKPGMIDRCLVAAYVAGMDALLVLTKGDLAGPEDLVARYAPLGLPFYVTSLPDVFDDGESSPATSPQPDNSVSLELREALTEHETVLVGHSGVGKSTLINALVPQANRTTGHVNEVTGKGRHTSTSAVSFGLPEGGRIIDTPGIRSFGLAHVGAADLLASFSDLNAIADDCPRGCPHTEGALECALSEVTEEPTLSRVQSFRRLLDSIQTDWSS
ncbi:MAG: ribosome small subunit-dependent GTPase A [Ancrocorticia sp.]|uniref:ribosome small subunit-dependent GTPase A n=1 Tax=Ancrocorticia sp. TaxID=2593684 RepID=UPI003F92BFDE